MPRGFTEKEIIRIREELLNNGLDFLKKFGVQKTTVEDLTSAVKISKGAFYRFFPSKEALFFNILESYEQKLKDKFLDLLKKYHYDDYKKGIKDITKNALYSSEMQVYFELIQREELSYILKTVEPEILSAHLEKDKAFFDNACKIIAKFGLNAAIEPQKILAYTSGLFCIFFGKHLIDKKYFEDVIDSYIDTIINKIF